MIETIPAKMTAIAITTPGGPLELKPERRDVPEPAPGQILIKVCAAVKKIGKHALVVEGNDIGYTLLYFSYLMDREKGPNGLIETFEDKTGKSWSDPVVRDSIDKELSLWKDDCIAADARGFQYPAGQQTIALGDSMADLNGS